MFEGAFPSPDHNPTPISATEPPIVWLEHGEGVAPGAVIQAPPERDAQAVIEFLLKKVEEHEAKAAEQDATIAAQQLALAEATQKAADHDALVEVLNVEIDQLRGQLQVTREELDRQLADYEVVMQNALATERDLDARKRELEASMLELDAMKQRSAEKPKISLPFHTEQKLAKLGWTDGQAPEAGVEAEAV